MYLNTRVYFGKEGQLDKIW